MEFADAHLAHQDPQWLSHTYQDMEWYKRNKANFASIFSSILKGWGQKKSLNDDDCLLCVSTWEVFCITPVSYQNRYMEPSAAEWIHFLIPLNKERTGPGVTVNRLHITVTTGRMTQKKNTAWLLPAHFTPWAMRPHMKLAQYSHQCGPLNVCTWKTVAERKITENDPTISQITVSMHVNSAEFLFFECTTCSFWKFPFIMAGKEERN